MDAMHQHSHHHVEPGPAGMTLTLKLAVVVTLLLVAVEIAAGYLGSSIALISDGVHNLSDVPTLVIAWLALVWHERPPTPEKTFGYRRAGILAAFTNGVLLVLVALYVLYEAIDRLRHPVEVRAGLMFVVAIVALVVNGGIALAVARGRRDLNLRTVLVHNLGDAVSNLAIIGGAVAIRLTGVHRVDGLLGLVIAAFVLWSSVGVLRDSSHVLLEGLPRELRMEDVAKSILGVPGVREVHDIHIWTLGTDWLALSCHIRIPDMHMEQSEKILEGIRARLAADFHITHVTVQLERAGPSASSGYYMPEPIDSPRGKES